jgi:hypothetical protein
MIFLSGGELNPVDEADFGFSLFCAFEDDMGVCQYAADCTRGPEMRGLCKGARTFRAAEVASLAAEIWIPLEGCKSPTFRGRVTHAAAQQQPIKNVDR